MGLETPQDGSAQALGTAEHMFSQEDIDFPFLLTLDHSLIFTI